MNSLKTSLLDGKKQAKFDQHIVGNLLMDHIALDQVRAEKLLIGVRNEDGEIYRLIGTQRQGSFKNAVEELFDLGLIDELEDTDATVEGCHAIFSEQ